MSTLCITAKMLEQDKFSQNLTTLLTPPAFRAEAKDDGASKVDIATWYNTAATTTAVGESSAAQGHELCHAEWGASKVPSGPSPDANTIFQACSISKPFQSLAVLRYISEGIISGLDAAVKSYLPDEICRTLVDSAVQKGAPETLAARLVERITILQLLSHTGATTGSGYQGYSTSASHIPSPTEILQGGAGKANSPAVYVHAVPGVQFEYSGGGSTILQAMLEHLGARHDGIASFAALMKTKVLDPLGMTRSFYCDSRALAASETNYAAGYHNGVHGLELGEYHIHPEQGTAGLWTTSADLVRGVTGFAHALLGTSAAIQIDGKPWIKPQVAREILRQQRRLSHGKGYYCGFSVQFFDGNGLDGDEQMVRISHAGGNYGYSCWTAATFPLPTTEAFDEDHDQDAVTVRAVAVMTNSNYGQEIIGPLLLAIGAMLDAPLGPGPIGSPFGQAQPAVALDSRPSVPTAGWEVYEGEWAMEDREGTMHIKGSPEPSVVFSQLGEDIVLPLWAVAERKGPETMRLRVSYLDATLEFGWKKVTDDEDEKKKKEEEMDNDIQGEGEGEGEGSEDHKVITLLLWTGGGKIKCNKVRKSTVTGSG